MDKKIINHVTSLIIIINLAVGLAYLIAEIQAIRQDKLMGADFSVFYSEGLMIREGYADADL